MTKSKPDKRPGAIAREIVEDYLWRALSSAPFEAEGNRLWLARRIAAEIRKATVQGYRAAINDGFKK